MLPPSCCAERGREKTFFSTMQQIKRGGGGEVGPPTLSLTFLGQKDLTLRVTGTVVVVVPS